MDPRPPAAEPPPTASAQTPPTPPRNAAGARATPSGQETLPAADGVAPALQGSALFLNRELSWLEFNQRVLEEARNAEVPLLERLKFITIAANNLDEFFMVRVAGLQRQKISKVAEVPADGMTPVDQLHSIAARARRMYEDLAATLREQVLPELRANSVNVVLAEELDESARAFARHYFRSHVMPVLTPLAIDPGHPFPHLRNKSLNLIALLSGTRRATDGAPAFAVVQVPGVLERLVPIPSIESPIAHTPGSSILPSAGGIRYVLLEDLIALHIGDLFPGFHCVGAWPFRVVRNFDLSLDDEDAEDLLESVRQEVRRRDRGAAVALTIDSRASAAAAEMLRAALRLESEFVFSIDGPINVADLGPLGRTLDDRALRDEPFRPARLPPLHDEDGDIFEAIAHADILLHHPYESFDPVVYFTERAAADPDVLAIKQTLYRTSGDSPIVKALVRAAENGKQVTALVEIKARFDEENNIIWARKLEEAGVHVVYGLVGLKTHCKTALVVRRELDPNGRSRIVRYVHLGTGNYNPSTARLYTDISLFTARPEFGEDATSLFNLLTSCTAPSTWRKLIVAPLGLHERVLALIEREASLARAGRPARIIAKMNSLVDPDVIQALYRASQAGVEIDLIIRGICCLRPGVAGLSERIRVRSIIDRFLEHARVFFFEAGGHREVYAASADWMPRNFQRRVEVMFPIEDEALKVRVVDELLRNQLDDNAKAWILAADGRYQRAARPENRDPLRSQRRYLDLAHAAEKRAEQRALRDRPFVVRPVRVRPTMEIEAPAPSSGTTRTEDPTKLDGT